MTETKSYQVLETIRDRISTIEFWDNGIIFIEMNDSCEVELNDSKTQYEFLRSKYNGKNKHLVLVEPGRYTSISKEAREFSQRPESNEMTLATAVIVKSLAHRIVINFIISVIHQQTMKMKMFERKDKAIEWLISQKEQIAIK